MPALPERAIAGFTDALLAQRLAFLDTAQRASTARFVITRWRLASQPVQVGTGVVAGALGAAAWAVGAIGNGDTAGAWRRIVAGLDDRSLPGVSELSRFVISLATAYAAAEWPGAAASATDPMMATTRSRPRPS